MWASGSRFPRAVYSELALAEAEQSIEVSLSDAYIVYIDRGFS